MNDTRKEDRVNVIRGHKRVVLALSVLTRLLSAALLIFTTYLPLFDSSPKLLLKPSDSLLGRWISTLLRWDAIHFTHIAQEKYYVYEHERAFFLGTPRLMQISAGLLKAAGSTRSCGDESTSGRYVVKMRNAADNKRVRTDKPNTTRLCPRITFTLYSLRVSFMCAVS